MKEAVNDINAANELWSDAGTTKLAYRYSIYSSVVDQQGVKVASVMIKTAKAILENTKTKLASVISNDC